MRFAIIALLLASLSRPVWADPELSQADRVTMLQKISETLGREAACGHQDVLKGDLPRYVFVMQIEKADDAMKAATAGVQDGFTAVKNGKVDCAQVQTDTDAIDGKLRGNGAITNKLMFDVASASGAALECGAPQATVDHNLTLVKTYAGMTSDDDAKLVQQWVDQGRKIIQLKLYSCDQAEKVAAAIPKYF